MIINEISQTEMSGLYIIFRGSVMNEKPGWYGISHLMEHLLCNRFKDYQDILQEDGITWNAMTSNTFIVFYMTGLDEYVKKHTNFFIEALLNFSLTEEELENEKKIVLEEYEDKFNRQNPSHLMNLNRKLFNNYGAIGLRSDLEKINMKDIMDFYKIQFKHPHTIVNVSKDRVLTDTNKLNIVFNDKDPLPSMNPILEPIPYELNNDFKNKSSIIDLRLVEDDFAILDFIGNMLGDGLKSPLYTEIREKRGLVYYIGCGIYPIDEYKAAFMISTETSDKNVDELQKLVKYVIENPKDFLTEKRFEIVKKSMLIELKKEEIDKYKNVYSHYMNDRWDLSKILPELTYDDVLEVYNKYLLDFDKWYLSVDKKEKFGK